MVTKTKINLDIVLPEVPDERDECVQRIISTLEDKKGIEKVHVVPKDGIKKARLCFHYDPDFISLSKVEELAKNAGAEITRRYGHLLIETSGVRQPRHARIIQAGIKEKNGIQTVSVSGTGFIQLEFDKEATSAETVMEQIKKAGLKIDNVEDFHLHEHEQTATPVKKPEEDGHVHVQDHVDTEHSYGGLFGEKTELIFAIICGAFLAIGFGLSFLKGLPDLVSIGFYIVAYFFGGFYTTKEAIRGISKGQFEIDFLMLVAAIGAAALGEWAEGALLLFLFSMGHSLEHYAMQKAKKSIAALTDLAPKIALLKIGQDVKEVNIEELKTGDVIVVKPNS